MPEIFKNKIVLGVGGVLLIALLIATFWFTQPKAAAPVLIDNSPVTLTWWKLFHGNDVYTEIINDFKAIPGNANVTINLVTRDYSDAGAYYRSLITDTAAGAGPDIFTIRNDDLPAYRRFMTPINNFEGVKMAEYKNNFVPLAVRDTMVNDKVYAITSYVDNLALYYNTDILAQAGIALPVTTWRELERQLPLLNKRDITGTKFTQSAISLGTGYETKSGNENINRFQDILSALVFQNGGQLYDYPTNTAIFEKNTSTAFNALRFYYDFSDSVTNRYSWNSNQSNNIDAFAEGRLAYMIHYSYLEDVLKQKNPRLNYQLSEIPQVNLSSKKTYGFFFMDGLNRKLETDVQNFPTDKTKARKLKKASDFMEFLSTPEAQSKFTSKTRLPGAHRVVIDSQLSRDDNIRIFAAGSLYADNYYKSDVDRIERMWGQVLYRTIYENQPLPDSLKQAITEYERTVNLPPELRR